MSGNETKMPSELGKYEDPRIARRGNQANLNRHRIDAHRHERDVKYKSEHQEREAREKKWQDIKEKALGITDKLGRPIDKKILDTVVALSAFGIQTTDSCEGHLDHGRPAPWVSFTSISLERDGLLQQFNETKGQMNKAFKQSRETGQLMTREEIDKLQAPFIKLRNQIKDIQAIDDQKVQIFLDNFYINREISDDVRLCIDSEVLASIALQSQGAENRDAGSKDLEQKLQEYQAEMQAFTTFLKQSFLDG